ncbi:MAG: LamG-like jellyroll fold domain-containing protein [Leptospiraceae bacterium]|nr:LamG-like jellyroll fold domain-containing protein [Leptospiraceae bacterium]
MIKILFITLLTFTISAEEIQFSGKLLSQIQKEKVQVVKQGENDYKIELLKNNFPSTELYLDFEADKASELKDKNGNYEIEASRYVIETRTAPYGKRYASFTNRDSYIAVSSNKNRILGQTQIKEPFYISFFIKSGESEQNSILFSKIYLTSGKKYGLECKILNSRINYTFHNMFSFENGKTKTISMESPEKLTTTKWTHVVLTLNPVTGRVALYENGNEKAEFQAELSESEPTIPSFGFHKRDTSPLIIGRDYYGKLDDFIISIGEPLDVSKLSLPYSDVKLDEPTGFVSQARGNAISKVIKTKYSKSIPQYLIPETEIPEGSHLEVQYRFSEEPFEEKANSPSWKHLEKNFNDTHKSSFFQYFQWKVILRANHSGTKSPSLKKLTLKYRESIPPNPPFGFKLSSLDSESLKVCFQWSANHEKDVNSGGGYLLHYGITPERMIGTIVYNDKGNKFGETKEENILGDCVDNSVIEKNLVLSQKTRTFPFFRNGITYYFRLSAYNNKFPLSYYTAGETIGIDQKSKSSKSISGSFKTISN